MIGFDENAKHSFSKCELVRILSTTITRSNTEFAKLSFSNIYNPIEYINECYNHLWKEWADDKISNNDILKDSSRWDEWMINYYSNCKSDYFGSINEMYTLMQFHTQSLNGDFSWVFKQENLIKISNHDGMVSTKLVNKLDYLLKKHNFGSLNLQSKPQKYRTRKRGGCKMCNQIRDVKRMLERQGNGDTSDNNDSNKKKKNKNNNNNNKSNLNDITSYGGSSNGNSNSFNQGLSMMSNTTVSVVQQEQYHEITNNQSGWKTTVISSGRSFDTLSNHSGHSGHSGHTSDSNSPSHISSSGNSSDSGSHSHGTSSNNSSSDNNTVGILVGANTYLSNNDHSSDSELMESVINEEIDNILLLTPTPPPPELTVNLDDLLSSVGVPNSAEIMNNSSLFPVSPLQTGKITNNLTNDKETGVGCDELITVVKNEEETKPNKVKSTLRATAAEFKIGSSYCTSSNNTSNVNDVNKIQSKCYDINRLFANVSCFMTISNNNNNSNNGSNSSNISNNGSINNKMLPDPSLREFKFDSMNINNCHYGKIVEFLKPTVLFNNNFNSYFYYIPRAYLCNIKTASQFKLAIENLTNWDESLYTRESAYYKQNDSNFGQSNNNFPDWLKGIEMKVLEMLTKFPQLNEFLKENKPNSCMMNNFENGDKSMNLHNEDGKYVSSQKGNFASITLALGATRTLVIGSMMEDHVFGVNLKYGDICIMAGKFESCYKYGIPSQSGINDNTLCVTFGKIGNALNAM